MSTFVSVGNARHPFRRLLDAVARLAPRLPQPVIVQHGHTPFAAAGCQAVAFLGMADFARRVSEAELLILHAGAGSVIHAIEAGKRPVVMPRRADLGEHVNNHQLEFARVLGETGRVVVAETPERLEAAIAEALAVANSASAAPLAAQGELRMVQLVREALADCARSHGE